MSHSCSLLFYTKLGVDETFMEPCCGRQDKTYNKCVVWKFVSMEEVLEEVGALIAGISPWHSWTHGTHLQTNTVWWGYACFFCCLWIIVLAWSCRPVKAVTDLETTWRVNTRILREELVKLYLIWTQAMADSFFCFQDCCDICFRIKHFSKGEQHLMNCLLVSYHFIGVITMVVHTVFHQFLLVKVSGPTERAHKCRSVWNIAANIHKRIHGWHRWTSRFNLTSVEWYS